MNAEKIIGLVSAVIECEAWEVIAKLQEYVEEINNNQIKQLVTLTVGDDDPTYEITIPDNIRTVLRVFVDGQPIETSYTEDEYMAGEHPTTQCCYVDKSRVIVFNQNVYGLTVKIKAAIDGIYTISTLPNRHAIAAENYVLYRLFKSQKYKDDRQASDYYKMYQESFAKVETDEVDIPHRQYGSDY